MIFSTDGCILITSLHDLKGMVKKLTRDKKLIRNFPTKKWKVAADLGCDAGTVTYLRHE